MLFLGTYTNRLDKKGRVSVPAGFGAALAGKPFQGIVVYASLTSGCVEACGMERIAKMNDFIETLPPFSEERDALATVVFGESQQLAFDSEGRVIVPAALLDFAGVKAEAVFVGKGEIFEIWSPEAHAERIVQARTLVKDKRLRTLTRGGKP